MVPPSSNGRVAISLRRRLEIAEVFSARSCLTPAAGARKRWAYAGVDWVQAPARTGYSVQRRGRTGSGTPLPPGQGPRTRRFECRGELTAASDTAKGRLGDPLLSRLTTPSSSHSPTPSAPVGPPVYRWEIYAGAVMVQSAAEHLRTGTRSSLSSDPTHCSSRVTERTSHPLDVGSAVPSDG